MTTTTDIARADVCVVAIAECFRGDGEIFGSPMGTVPTIGARLARATFEPDLVLSDGESLLFEGTHQLGVKRDEFAAVGWIPFRAVLDVLASGRRHVVMGPVQIDRYGNANISAIGDWARPKRQVLGARGGPGNTVNHTTSYWVPRHAKRVFTPSVDMVSCVGHDRAAELGAAARFHEVRRVVSNLGVFDFVSADGGPATMRLASAHPGVTVDEIADNTGFPLVVPDDVPETRSPTADELRLIREVIDPRGLRLREVPA
ncbi:CoA-transferase [Yinghuangia sp. ASG 101]|uniref:CoA-transferase subunit beta n=1 Tax=Yinghuangia sp. ASG 101 TaxID=2896848 RepID=UPI001E455CD6|nr:CoA-transferase [Yinghuangia sp. ASG 101]UGQ09274.1 CoA-transferase [Yinghuangia sp. ASG 101]